MSNFKILSMRCIKLAYKTMEANISAWHKFCITQSKSQCQSHNVKVTMTQPKSPISNIEHDGTLSIKNLMLIQTQQRTKQKKLCACRARVILPLIGCRKCIKFVPHRNLL
jgi:hypothetical protein